ncbi:hemagglutinin repeat-containing protein [Marinospirillum alkaliphilum]|uniref:Filamentous hemagglutinin family N-terminal domain-containing protein n=1 Tax=Marinospirillum alkaliphilum DSM 21637 TaxID=1122209 RepID=A0A1K1YXD2_9GAMM|nr:hemagglutinin repeat-containing protein [Marinospirillum alkaliphilum]SFX66479.1 filamentous hemagglutinin family N-terminal domain-containing protein [Marinospirillum alkaliphilum DSM 21637]
MNRNCYQVIFNRHKGQTEVVSEIAARDTGGAISLGGGSTTLQRRILARLHPVSMALLLLAGATMTSIDPAQARIIADPGADASKRPTVFETGNGVPLVNIRAPGSSGVSHNVYKQFDVDQRGAILNNSSDHSQTQLGGWVQGNDWLQNNQSARIILNEVNSNQASRLNGYMEVAGHRAQVIVANPSGITCDGCGFINASRGSLITGKPEFSGNQLTGYRVGSGNLSITGKGLDGRTTDYLDIIGQTVKINAGIWGQDIRVVGGNNQLDPALNPVTQIEADMPTVGISVDVSHLGGMYAGKIHLIGTPTGVGVNTAEIRNQGYIEAHSGDLVLTADGRIENSGSLVATHQAQLSTAVLDNRNGAISVGNQLNILTGQLDNRDGLLVSQSDLDIQSDSLQNHQGIVAAQDTTRLQVNDLNNTQGAILSSGLLSLDFDRLDNSHTLEDDQGIQAAELQLQGREVINLQGSLLSSVSTSANLSGSLDNTRGLISSSGLIKVQDTGNSLDIINEAGLIIADEQLDLRTETLVGEGDLVSLKDLNLELGAAFTYQDGIYIGRHGNLVFHDSFQNEGLLQAGGNLTLTAADIHNTQEGEITAFQTHIITASDITNRGLIDGQITRIDADNLYNLGSGRIYGDDITLVLDNNLYNTREDGRSAVIAARDGLQAAFSELHNTDNALIFSLGNMALGGSLDDENQVDGRANLIHNAGGSIDAQGNLFLSADLIENLNPDFQTALVQIVAPHKVTYIRPNGSNRMVPVSEYRWASWSRAGQYVHRETGTVVRRWTQYEVTESTSETQVTHSTPGQMLAGGHLVLDADSLINDKSRILVGGSLIGDIENLENREALGENIVYRSGTSQYTRGRWRGGLKRYHQRDWGEIESYRPAPLKTTINLSITELAVNTDTSLSSADHDISSTRTLSGSVHRSRSLTGKLSSSPDHESNADNRLNIQLPTNSLFNIHSGPESRYLVETDPRFTNYRNWISSDHLLTTGNFVVTARRLGDGFYEQQLIRDQLANLTGRRFLDGFSDDDAQYLHLMNNALAIAEDWNLRPGVALTPEQIAALTSDIVWMVEQEVMLPDGSIEQVLVPQVYARVTAEDLQPGGALIAANTIDLNLAGDLTNSGALIGQRDLNISAGNISNLGGRISGNRVHLSAEENFTMQGGLVQGQQHVGIDAGQNLDISSTQTSGESRSGGHYFSHTSMDQQASITVTGEQGSLALTAGQDLVLAAAHVENKGNGNTLLQAEGDILITSLETGSISNTVTNGSNFQKLSNTEHQGSSIHAGGNLQLVANGSAQIHASDLNATDTLSVNAESIAITAGINQATLHEASVSTTRSRRQTEDTGFLEQTAAGSSLTGGNIQLQANTTIHLTGSSLDAENDLIIGNLAVEQQEDGSFKAINGEGTPDQLIVDTLELTNESWHHESTSYRGAMGSVMKGVGVLAGIVADNLGLDAPKVVIAESASTHDSSTTHQGSELNAGNNLVMAASENIHVIAGTLNAVGNAILSASQVILDAAEDKQVTETRRSEESVSGSGLSLGKDEITLASATLTEQTTTERTTKTSYQGSSINAGNLVMLADDLSILASQVNVENDALLQADNITVGGYKARTVTEYHQETETTTITAGVRNAYVDTAYALQAVNDATKAVEDAHDAYRDARRRVERGELAESALKDYEINRAAATAQLAQATLDLAASGATAAASTATGGFYATAGAETTVTETRSTTTEGTWQGSSLNIGGNATFNATNSLNIVGSSIGVNNTLTLNADQVNITAGTEHSSSSSNETTHSAGTSFSTSSNAFSANASTNQTDTDSSSKIHVNSQISAGNLNSTSQAFMVAGAEIEIKNDIDISTGHFILASLQDTHSTNSQTTGASVGASLSGGSLTSIGGNYSGTESQSQWVGNQTFLTGGGQVNITADQTDIKGATLASATRDENGHWTDKGNLTLTTDALNVTSLYDSNTTETRGINLNVGLSKTGSSTLGLTDIGHNTEQTTHGTLGSGTIQTRNGEQHDLADVNRDLNASQEITLDQQTGALDASVTIDHRLATQQGREAIKNDFVDTYEHGQDIGRTAATVYGDEHLGLLNFAEALDQNAKGIQLKNDLLRNPDNQHILDGLTSGDPELYAQAMSDLGHLAQDKFGLDLSDINFYDAQQTTSIALADTIFTDIKGGTVADQNHAEYGNIFIDAGDSASKTDLTNTLGHEIMESRFLQGQDGGLTNGLFGTHSTDTQEALANAFGGQLADRINQAAGGQLDSSGGADFGSNLKNSQAVATGTQRADTVGNVEVRHRQLYTEEAQAILGAASAYAAQHDISEEQAKRELTQQALRQVDQTWSEQIEENDRARGALTDLAAGMQNVAESPIGRNFLDIILDTETSPAFAAKDEATFNDTNINAREARLAEDLLKNEDGVGFYTAYATQNGEKPIEIGLGEAAGQAYENAKDTVEAIVDDPLGVGKAVLVGMYEDAWEAITDPLGTFVYTDSTGSPEDRQFVAEMQGNREAALQEAAAGFMETVEELLPPVMPARAVVGEVGKEAAEQAAQNALKAGNGSHHGDAEMVGQDGPTYSAVIHGKQPADDINQTMADQGRVPAWTDGSTVEDVTLLPGYKVEQIVDTNTQEQLAVGSNMALGRWASTDPLPNTTQAARDVTAVKKEWKNDDGGPLYVVEIEVTDPVNVNRGSARPVYDERLDRELPGQTTQVEFKNGKASIADSVKLNDIRELSDDN